MLLNSFGGSDREADRIYERGVPSVDTEGTKINAAETRRVLAEAFRVLCEQDANTAVDIVASGMKKAAKKVSK